jgi:hypothetical protein
MASEINKQDFNQWYLEVCQVAAAHEVVDIPHESSWIAEWQEGLEPIDAFYLKVTKQEIHGLSKEILKILK